jgi:hypothetical protein
MLQASTSAIAFKLSKTVFNKQRREDWEGESISSDTNPGSLDGSSEPKFSCRTELVRWG